MRSGSTKDCSTEVGSTRENSLVEESENSNTFLSDEEDSEEEKLFLQTVIFIFLCSRKVKENAKENYDILDVIFIHSFLIDSEAWKSRKWNRIWYITIVFHFI